MSSLYSIWPTHTVQLLFEQGHILKWNGIGDLSRVVKASTFLKRLQYSWKVRSAKKYFDVFCCDILFIILVFAFTSPNYGNIAASDGMVSVTACHLYCTHSTLFKGQTWKIQKMLFNVSETPPTVPQILSWWADWVRLSVTIYRWPAIVVSL